MWSLARRIYISVYGSGLGHASRMTLLAERLRGNGYEVRLSSSLEATEYIRSHGFECDDIPSIEVGWNNKGEVSIRRTLKRFLPSLGIFSTQISRETNNLRKFCPDLVISDSRLSTVIAARRIGIPVYVVLNQLKLIIPTPYESTLKNVGESFAAEILGKLWSRSEAIIIPDLPPPYTISEKNLQNIRSARRKMKYIGFISNDDTVHNDKIKQLSKKLSLDKDRIRIFVPISGPSTTREVLKGIIFRLASKLRDQYCFIISGGDPNSNVKPLRIQGGWYYGWCPVRDELMKLSNIIIARSGHLTTAQSIIYGKPMLTIPIPNYTEQIKNSEKIVKLGIGIQVNQSLDMSVNLQEAITNLVHNSHIQSRVKNLQRISKKHDGVDTLVKLVEYRLRNITSHPQ